MKKLSAVAIFAILSSITSFAQIPIVYYDFEQNSNRNNFENAVEMSINTPPVGAVFSYTTSGPGGCNTIGCPNAQGLQGAAASLHGGSIDGGTVSSGAWSPVTLDPLTAAASYFQFSVNTQGFTGISLTFDTKYGNGNSPEFVGVLISNNGTSWTHVGSTGNPNGNTIPVKPSNQSWSNVNANFNLSANAALAAIANNNANLFIRIYGYGASGGGGGGTYLALDNVTIFAISTTAGKVFTTMDENLYAAGYSSGASTTTLARGGFTASGAGTNVTINGTSGLRMNTGQTFAVASGATATFGATGVLHGTGSFNIVSGGTIAVSNTGGVPAVITTSGTNTYTAGANYTFNAITSTPFPATMGNPGNVTINPGAGNNVTLNLSPTITGVLSFTAGRLVIGAQTLTLNGTVSGMSAANSITGGATSNLVIGGTGALGTLFFNQTTPGTTNAVNTFTLNRTGSGTASLGNAINIGNGGLALTAGSLADGGNVITLSGNISGTGTHTSSSFGKILMTGSGSTISSVTLGNLELNNAGGFGLTGTPIVEGVLTLTNGKLTLGANNFTLGTAATIGGTPSASNMMVTNGVGKVRKLFSALGNFTYPVGDNTNYTPITLEMLNGTFAPGAAVGVTVKNVKHPNNANVTNYINRYWQASVTGITDLIYGVQSAKYVPADVVGSETNIAMGQYTGALPWERYGAANSSTHTLSLIALLEPNSDFSGISSINPTVTANPATTAACPSNPATLTATGATGDPALTYKWLPAAGLSATTGTSVTANPSSNTVYTLTITDGNGFTATSTSTVNVENIQPITGNTLICLPGTTTLNTVTSGGTWQTTDGAIATVGATDGVVTGHTAGTATISYVMPSGCYVTSVVTVQPTPAAITGTFSVCDGLTTQLNHAVGSGTWMSSAIAIATVNTSGLVTGDDAGTATITYTLPNGCPTTAVVTVNATPPAITGMQQVCVGADTDFDVADAGGTWGSLSTAIATVDANGLVHGVAQGNTTITYTNSVGCSVTRTVTVNETPEAITGDLDVCKDLSSQLATTSSGGAWSVANPGVVASISTTGLVTAIDAGTATISYSYTPSGCAVTAVFTVYALPAAIGGPSELCKNSTVLISGVAGFWESDDEAIATIDGSGFAFGESAGSTYITYTDGNGCKVVKQITVNPLPGTITGDVDLCLNETSQLTSSGAGNWVCACATPGMSLNSTGMFTAGGVGTTTVSYVLSPSGCYTSAVVTVHALPAPIIGPDQVCVTAAIQLTNSGSGTWSSSAVGTAYVDATGLVDGISAGTANITFTSAAGCVAVKPITVNALPDAITGADDVCVNATITLSSAPTGGTWSSGDDGIASLPSASAGTVLGEAQGVVNITYTLPTTCSTSKTITVNALPGAISGTAQVCIGSGGTATSSPLGGTWESGDEGVLTIDINGNMASVSVGTSVITYTSPVGCSATRIISVNPYPEAITGITGFCVSTTTDLDNTDVGGFWNSIDGSASVSVDMNTGVVTGNTVGTATVVYTSQYSCAVSTEVTVYALPDNIIGANEVCVGSEIDLAATEIGTWHSTNVTVASINSAGTISGNDEGTSTIEFTNNNGCKRSIQVTVHETPAAITGDLRICDDATTQLSTTPTGGMWSVTGTAASVDVNGLVTATDAGTALIKYALPTGCYREATVTVDALPDAITGNAPLCEEGSLMLANTTAGGSWSTSDDGIADITISGGELSGISEGNATITYATTEGCITTVEATVNALPASIDGVAQVCTGLVTDLDNTTLGGTWSSSTPAVGTVDASTGEVTGITNGTTIVTYMLGTGCKAFATVTVNQTPAITFSSNVCKDATVTFTAMPSGGEWHGDDVVASAGISSGIITGLLAGTADITYILSTGCNTSTIITVNELPAAITGVFAACEGTSSMMDDPGTGGAWSSSNNAIADIDATGNVSALADGNATITYTLPTGCFTTQVYTVNPLPSSFTGAVQICEGTTGVLGNTQTGGTWLSADNAIADVVAATGAITANAAGTVAVTYTLPSGCVRSETVTVNAAVPAITGGMQVCEGASLTLGNTEGGGTWTSADAAIASIGASDGLLVAIAPGAAHITYTLATGCFNSIEVSVNALPATITGTMQLCAGLTTTLNNTTLGGSWSGGASGIGTIDASGVVTSIAAGTVPVTYTISTTGCKRTATVTVHALPTVQNVTGGGSYCIGGAGVHIGLSNSVPGNVYTLKQGTLNVLAMVGTGTPLDYGLYTTAGTYTVAAANASTGCTKEMAGSAVVTINPLVTPSVTISSTVGDTSCAGLAATFTANPVNGGTAPVYEWMVNSTVVSASSSYSYTPVNGDVVKVKMTSTAVCPSPAFVTASKNITVLANQTPTIAITKTSGDTTCVLETATFHSTITWGGNAPVYTWMRNGAPVGSGATFSYTPTDGDVVTCKLTSNYRCRLITDVTSTGITMDVDSVYVPIVTISAAPSLVVVPNKTVTLTATVANGGPLPYYQWMLNGFDLPGENSPILKRKFADGDEVKCMVYGSGACGLPSFNTVFIDIDPTASVADIATLISDVRLLPNPNNGQFTVSGNTKGLNEEVILEITNMLGQLVHTSKATVRNGVFEETIRLEGSLANGMYLLTLRTGDSRSTVPFVLKQ